MRACPAQSAGRPLAQEEEELRRLWIALVYLTIDATIGNIEVGSSSLVPKQLRTEHARLVSKLVEARRTSVPLSEVSLAEAAGPTKGEARDAMATAVLTQSMRVVYLTVDVLESIDLAGGRADTPKERRTPKPFIPGASVES
jgi:hypothetical protein